MRSIQPPKVVGTRSEQKKIKISDSIYIMGGKRPTTKEEKESKWTTWFGYPTLSMYKFAALSK
jgi:hypothetical protein